MKANRREENMIKIAICDDEELFRSEMEKFVSVYGNESDTEIEIDTYESASQMVKEIHDSGKRYDILFTDIEMPGLDGMEAAMALREMGETAEICFVTSHGAYALNSYQVDAVGYIMKPIKYTEVKRAIDRAKISINYRRDAQKAKKRYLDIKTSRNNVTIDLEKVVYIEKRRNQCVFHLEDGEYICYETLSKIYERLDHDSFIYTHQGFIASFHHIKEVKRNAVCFGCGVEIPISRKYYEPVKAMHMDKIYRLRDEKNHSQNHS